MVGLEVRQSPVTDDREFFAHGHMIYGDADDWQYGGPTDARRAMPARVREAALREPILEMRRVRRDVEVAGHDERPGRGRATRREHRELGIARRRAPRRRRRVQM